jgi:polysaccharide export outer membrane protein
MRWQSIHLGIFLIALQALATYAGPSISYSSADGDYRLGPKDAVQVWMWKEPDLSTTSVVRPDGKLALPLIGELQAEGLSAPQLQKEIQQKLRAYLAEPVVTLIVKEINYPKISVLGKVRKPDVYKIRQKTTVLDAIAMAGGLTEYANRSKVLVIRNESSQQQKIPINLKCLEGGDGPCYLQPPDTVSVQ